MLSMKDVLQTLDVDQNGASIAILSCVEHISVRSFLLIGKWSSFEGSGCGQCTQFVWRGCCHNLSRCWRRFLQEVSLIEHVVGERSTLGELLPRVIQAISQYLLGPRVPMSEAVDKDNKKSKITQLASSVQHLEIDATDAVAEMDKGEKEIGNVRSPYKKVSINVH